MFTRYFRKKDPLSKAQNVEWVEMSGKEYYQFVTDLTNAGRHFVDMGDVVLEATENEMREYISEKNHNYYLQAQEEGWITLSFYSVVDQNGCSGEEVAVDETQDVEEEAIAIIEHKALRDALLRLDTTDQQMIYDLYLAVNRKTERDLADKCGLSQVAIHKQKKKILDNLKFLVIKLQKSQQ